MCSIGEDDFGDNGAVHSMIPEPLSPLCDPIQGDCKKCGKTSIEVYKLNFREAECRDCFLLYVRHKFRAVLGSSKVLPRDAKVLLIFDSSPESVVLLDMLYHAQRQNNFKRLHCSAKIVYIDDNILFLNEEQSIERIRKIQSFLGLYEHFESYIISIGCDLNSKPCNIHDLNNYIRKNSKETNEFMKNFKKIKSLTSQQDLLKTRKSLIISSVTQSLDCQFAFEANISSTLAIQLLSTIALGRGGSAALDVALVDDRLRNDVKLVRPLKDLNQNEVNLYLQAQKLKCPVICWRYGESFGSGASLQNLTVTFITNLQMNFTSTASTIFRIGDKIAPNYDTTLKSGINSLTINETERDKLFCHFCHSSLDYHNSKTLLAVEFSRIICNAGSNLDNYSNLDREAEKNIEIHENNSQPLCHSCRSILNEYNNFSTNLIDFK